MFGTNNLLTSLLPPSAPPQNEAPAELPAPFINRHRLPDTEQLQGNELAHREDIAVPEDELWDSVKERIALFLGLVTLGTFALHGVALVSFWWALTGACAVGGALGLGYLWLGVEVRVARMFLALLLPPLAMLPAYFLATGFLSARTRASFLLTALALALLVLDAHQQQHRAVVERSVVAQAGIGAGVGIALEGNGALGHRRKTLAARRPYYGSPCRARGGYSCIDYSVCLW